MTHTHRDEWLDPFVGRLARTGRPVLDLGCGPGDDAAFLASRGFTAIGLDRRSPAPSLAGRGASFVRGDLRWLPFRETSFDTVIASLSLHYLPWNETVAAFRAATGLLREGGVFLFRVNADDDLEHGAGLGVEVEPGFRRMPAGYGGYSSAKRFFDEQMVRAALPPSLAIERLEHRTIHRYEAPKRVWECLAVRLG